MALIEPSLAACTHAKQRGLLTVICGALSENSVRDHSIKQITLLDVLEHIEHDEEFLKMLWKKMQIEGRILLTVPAFPLLWSSIDDSGGHYRRYRVNDLKNLVNKAGFEVLYINYFFEFLFLPVLLGRVGLEKIGLLKRREERTEEEEKRIKAREFKERKGIVRNVLDLLEGCEIKRLVQNRKIRFGSSIICVLKKSCCE